MTVNFGDVSKAMRLAFNKCPNCGDKSLVYGHWLRWCKWTHECGWYGPQPTKKMVEEAAREGV